MHAFIKGKTVETESRIYQFSSESRAREFLRRAYREGEVSASGKVEPVCKEQKQHQSSCAFLLTH
jgi:hypothetical protein